MISAVVETVKKSLRFALVTRHLNRSGYSCLNALLRAGYKPEILVVSKHRPSLSSRWKRPFVIGFYALKCWFYRCRPLRVIQSEELYARSKGIKIYAADSLKNREVLEYVSNLSLDLLVVAGGWHEKLPIAVLQAPRKGSINVHPSLLPEFRGTSVTRWQVLEGVQHTGVTIHQMDEEFDTGATIAQTSTEISSEATPQELFQKLADMSGALLVDVLSSIQEDSLISLSEREVDQRYVRYYSKWKWSAERLCINIEMPLVYIQRQILASTQESYEYPGPKLILNGKMFMIRAAVIGLRVLNDIDLVGQPDYAMVDHSFLRWERAAEPGALLITQIQPCKPLFYLRRADKPVRWFESGEKIAITAAGVENNRV